MIYKYLDYFISEEEMNEIEEMEAVWTADLERKIEYIKGSMANEFAFAIAPLYEIKDFKNVPENEKMDVLEKIQDLLEQACSINTYNNNIDELDAVNSLPVDYMELSKKQYNSVSYVMPANENSEPLVIAYNMNMN